MHPLLRGTVKIAAEFRRSLAAIAMFFAALTPLVGSNPRTAVPLDGNGWQLTHCPVHQGEAYLLPQKVNPSLKPLSVTVPNNVQLSGFVRNPLGQSPELVDVNKEEWWYSLEFLSPQVGPGRQARLIFDGVDYFADVWINGVKLGSHEGAYTRFEFDITDRLLNNSLNYLAVRVTAPWKVEGRSHYEFMKGEFEETWDALPGPGQVVFPLGIHRGVRLEVTGTSRITNIGVWTVGLQDHGALLQCAVQIANRAAVTTGHLQVTITPVNFSGPAPVVYSRSVRLQDHSDESTKVDFDIEVKDPHLWWTWDLGAQDLYRAEAVLLDADGSEVDLTSIVFGIRTLERDKDLLYRINGKPVFMRGAWYPMSKLYPASTDRWTYEKDLRLARNANMNHLVNYTVVEKEDFYELADQLGILLFIELPFNQEGPIDALNAAYPRRKEFLAWSASEVRQIIRQLNNHPSIGVWSAVSEVTENGHDFRVAGDPRVAEAADGYSLFVKTIQDVVEEEDRDALYFRSYCDFGEHHFWEGTFFNGTTYDQQFDASASFISEYGALAFFPFEDVARVVDPRKVWSASDPRRSSVRLPVNLKQFSYVQPWQYFGLDFFTAEISAYVSRDIKSFRDYVAASQIYQSFIYSYAGDAYRRKLFSPVNGVRSWMLKSFPEVPLGGFGVIDAFDQAVPAYYAQRRTFAPVTMSFAMRLPLESVPGGSQLSVPVWVSNASGSVLSEVKIVYSLFDLKGSRIRSETVFSSISAGHSQQVANIVWQLPDEEGIYLLRGQAVQAGVYLAGTETYVKVVAAATRKPLRVLVVGSPEWALPTAEYLTGLGAIVTRAIAENTVIRPIQFPASAQQLRRDYDVIWLAGYNNYWREAPEQITRAILEAVHSGVAFVHTGSPASFHGGGERTAGLDLTGLAELMPVTVAHENDIYLKSSYKAGDQVNELSSRESHQLRVTANAPKWMQNIPLSNLAPDSFHMLAPDRRAHTLIEMDGLPMLVSGRYGNGQTFAYMGFSPESSIRTDHKPVILDRAIQDSSQGKLFAMVSATLLALASGEPPTSSINDLVESRAKPVFETLMHLPQATAPIISAIWNTNKDGKPVGRIRIENGDRFAFRLRVRMDGDDARSGHSLALWTDQYFDLLPHEVGECTVTLLQADGFSPRPFQIITESMAGLVTKYSKEGDRNQATP